MPLIPTDSLCVPRMATDCYGLPRIGTDADCNPLETARIVLGSLVAYCVLLVLFVSVARSGAAEAQRQWKQRKFELLVLKQAAEEAHGD